MARLNIEDKFWLEIASAAIAMGDQDKAIGNAIRFFRVAQEKAKSGEFLSEAEFGAHGFSEALFPMFAVRTERGIQAAGHEKHFDWLQKRVEAGRKGGSKPKQTKANGSKTRKTKQTEPSPSYSSSPSSSNSSSISENTPPEGANKSPIPGNPVVAAYYREWGNRYPGERPVLLPQHFKFLKTLGDQEGTDRAEKYVTAFLAMPDPWFLKKRHDVETLRQNLNAVSHFLSTGKVLTTKVLTNLEEQVDKAQGTSRRPRKSVEQLEAERAAMLAEANGTLALVPSGKDPA